MGIGTKSPAINPEISFIDPEELQKRPSVRGIAIDPPNTLEIDDAIWVEHLKGQRNVVRVQIHVADAGLLLGSPYVDKAREIGWSNYDAEPVELMLPESVALRSLGLNVNHFGFGSPAVTTEFNLHRNSKQVTNVRIYKSRLNCRTLEYGELNSMLHSNVGAQQLHEHARRLNPIPGRVNRLERGRQAEGIVREFMLAGNRVIAGHMQALGLPWLFRNHHLFTIDHPSASLVQQLYPDTELFAAHNLAWYSRIATEHQGIGAATYCHFTSPLRRFPDLVNHLTLSAHEKGDDLPYSESELDEIVREMASKAKACKLGRAIIDTIKPTSRHRMNKTGTAA